MTVPTPDSEALAAAKGLTEALGDIGRKITGLTSAVRRSRHMITGLAVSLCIDIALTVIVAVFAVQAHDASASAVAARDAAAVAARDNRALCLSGNVARAEEIQPWEYLVRLSRPPGTQKQKHLLAVFLSDLKRIYALRNCSQISAGTP